MGEPKYEIGTRIIFKDSYWGKLQGVIDMVATQRGKYVYRVMMDDGRCTSTRENQITKVINK